MHKLRLPTISLLILAFLLSISSAGCGRENAAVTTQPELRTIVDMAGREVKVPRHIKRVFSSNPPGTILLYTVDPDLLIAWNYSLGEAEKRFIPAQYHQLPNLGGWMAKTTCNIEELLKIGPDIILYMVDITAASKAQADEIQSQVNIPVVIVDDELTRMEASYEFLGRLLQQEEQAEILGTYCREAVQQVEKLSPAVSDDKQLRVYYAEGENGLETDPCGSRHTQVLDMVGGVNVAEVIAKGERGLTQVSYEQLLLWDPDLIICWEQCFAEILKVPNWQNIKAVQDKRVYSVPGLPFNWFDRPPSVNRVIGLKWLGHLLYPEVYAYDIANEIRDFYQKFYHYELSDEEIQLLLKDSGGR